MPHQTLDELIEALRPLRFGPPVTHVYNPLEYAREPYERYLDRFGSGRKEVLFIGMNPGPFGMAQTGVPFGDVGFVRDWLRIEGRVDKPAVEHPKRPILGYDCTRSEISGSRVWGWAQQTFGTPERFFERFVIANYCPLVFMEESGRNLTPDKLPKQERDPLFAACDANLRHLVEMWRPQWVVGIGVFAEGRAKEALAGIDVRIGRILHPSPASPLANAGWGEAVAEELRELGISIP
jgi:single-strand selective monofunctional uracil DNA glycosylase